MPKETINAYEECFTLKSNKRYIDQARKNADRNFDARKLDKIQQGSKLNWLSDNKIVDPNFSTPNKIRLPDLIVKGMPEIILEHDTVKLHGELGWSNERTLKRNQDYARTKRPFIIVNEDLAKMLKLNEASLATYLYYHELEQWRSHQL